MPSRFVFLIIALILVDTSVWIDFFRQKLPISEQLEDLLEQQQVVTIEPVFSELLYGVRTGRDRDLILSYWKLLPKIPFEAGAMMAAADFANKNNYHNLGVGLMDASIIVPVISQELKIWTLDKRIINAMDSEYLFG